MSISTYSGLKLAVANWLNRTDLTEHIPDFISLAEAELNRKVRVLDMESRVTYSSSDEYQFLPGNTNEFIELKRARIMVAGRPRQLRVLSVEQADELIESLPLTGTPQAVCFEGGRMRVVPAPDDTYDWDVVIYKRIPALTDSNTTNWLLTSFPDAYLYGALMHSAPFLRDDERVQMWAAKFQQVLAEIGLSDERALYGTGTIRVSMKAIG